MFDHETQVEAIALALWEEDTGNGTGIDRDEWDSHMEICRAAVNNSYAEGISVKDWYAAAKARLHNTQPRIKLTPGWSEAWGGQSV